MREQIKEIWKNSNKSIQTKINYEGNLPNEVWKYIEDFKEFGDFYASDQGRVYNKKTGRLLGENKNRVKVKDVYYNKGEVIWNTFYPDDKIEKGCTCRVYFKDKNKCNCKLDNLGKCTTEEEYKFITIFFKETGARARRAVNYYDDDGNFIIQFPSLRAAGRYFDMDKSNIKKICDHLNYHPLSKNLIYASEDKQNPETSTTICAAAEENKQPQKEQGQN